MPQLPVYQLERDLQARSGFPALTPQAPALQRPEVPLGYSQAVGGAVARAGEALQGAGELVAQAQELQARSRQADDVLAAKSSGQTTLPQLREMAAAEEQDADYASLPERVLLKGRALIDESGLSLSPRAKQLYAAEMRDQLNVLHQHALGAKLKRRDELALQVWEKATQSAESDYYAAATPLDKMAIRARLQETADQMVQTGLARGGVIQDRLQKFEDTVQIQSWQRQMRADPAGTAAYLYSLNVGHAPRPDKEPVPPGALDALTREAEQLIDKQSQRTEHQERYTEWRTAKEAQARTVFYRSQVSAMDPTPDSVPRLRQLIDLANSPAELHVLGAAGHQEVTTLLRGTLNMALAAGKRDIDDPATDIRLRVAIASAQTSTDLNEVERDLMQNGAEKLKGTTFTTLSGLIRQRRDDQNPLNRPAYRAGVDYILRAEIVPPRDAASGVSGREQQQVSQTVLRALDQYEREYRSILTREGESRADADAGRLAQEARNAYFPPVIETMPLELQGARDVTGLHRELNRLAGQGVRVDVLRGYEDAWRKARDANQLQWQKAPLSSGGGLPQTVLPPRPSTDPNQLRRP